MEYTLIDIIDGMKVELKRSVPEDFEKQIISQIMINNESFMSHKQLCISLVESWLNSNASCDYDVDLLDEYVGDWYDDFFGDWLEKHHDDVELVEPMKIISI